MTKLIFFFFLYIRDREIVKKKKVRENYVRNLKNLCKVGNILWKFLRILLSA